MSILLSNIWRILESVRVRCTNKNKKACLTVDCSGNILNGPRKFGTEADNSYSQTWYFNAINDEQLFNVYISEQMNNSEDNEDIQFKIIHLKS